MYRKLMYLLAGSLILNSSFAKNLQLSLSQEKVGVSFSLNMFKKKGFYAKAKIGASIDYTNKNRGLNKSKVTDALDNVINILGKVKFNEFQEMIDENASLKFILDNYEQSKKYFNQVNQIKADKHVNIKFNSYTPDGNAFVYRPQPSENFSVFGDKEKEMSDTMKEFLMNKASYIIRPKLQKYYNNHDNDKKGHYLYAYKPEIENKKIILHMKNMKKAQTGDDTGYISNEAFEDKYYEKTLKQHIEDAAKGNFIEIKQNGINKIEKLYIMDILYNNLTIHEIANMTIWENLLNIDSDCKDSGFSKTKDFYDLNDIKDGKIGPRDAEGNLTYVELSNDRHIKNNPYITKTDLAQALQDSDEKGKEYLTKQIENLEKKFSIKNLIKKFKEKKSSFLNRISIQLQILAGYEFYINEKMNAKICSGVDFGFLFDKFVKYRDCLLYTSDAADDP